MRSCAFKVDMWMNRESYNSVYNFKMDFKFTNLYTVSRIVCKVAYSFSEYPRGTNEIFENRSI